MKIKDHIQYWLDSAAHDWDTTENLFAAGKMNSIKDALNHLQSDIF